MTVCAGFRDRLRSTMEAPHPSPPRTEENAGPRRRSSSRRTIGPRYEGRKEGRKWPRPGSSARQSTPARSDVAYSKGDGVFSSMRLGHPGLPEAPGTIPRSGQEGFRLLRAPGSLFIPGRCKMRIFSSFSFVFCFFFCSSSPSPELVLGGYEAGMQAGTERSRSSDACCSGRRSR